MEFQDWEEPLQLVTINDGKLKIHEEAADRLLEIDLPIVPIGISGSYRGGKSYLMNRIANKKNAKGFGLGHALDSYTKGIWIWCLKHPNRNDTVLILLDTEGLGSYKENSNIQDLQLITLTVLLSTLFIYNQKSVIDSNTIDKMFFVTEIVKQIKINDTDKASKNPNDYWNYFPTFTLVLRDVYLELEVKNRSVTPDQYFEEVLAPSEDDKNPQSTFNQTRKVIKSAFKNYRCFVLPLPLKDMGRSKEMETLLENEFAPKFVTECNHLCEFLYHSAMTYMIGFEKLTGKSFLNLLKTFVEKFNSGKDICLEPTTELIIGRQIADAKKSYTEIYNEEMDKMEYPVSMNKFQEYHNYADEKAMEYFSKCFCCDEDAKIFDDLKIIVSEEQKKFTEKNEKASMTKCSKVLNDLYETLLHKKIKTFYSPGGYSKYKNIIDEIHEIYSIQTKEELMHEKAIEEFQTERESERDSIMNSDEALTEAEKEKERERIEREQREAMVKALQKAEERQKQYETNLIRTYKADVRKLQRQLQNTEEERIRDCESSLEQRKKERDRFLDLNRIDVVHELEEQITDLELIIETCREKINRRHRLLAYCVTGATIASAAALTGGVAALAGGVAALTGGAAAVLVAPVAAKLVTSIRPVASEVVAEADPLAPAVLTAAVTGQLGPAVRTASTTNEKKLE